MARVKEVKLVWHYGDTFDDYAVVWQDAAGTPINLTGYTANLKIKNKVGTGATTLLTLTSSDGLTITPLSGRIDFSATAAKMLTGTFTQGSVYFYDLEVVGPGAVEVKTLIKGQFWVDAQVSD